MNIDAVVYVRPPVRGETAAPLEMDGPNRILTKAGGAALDVQQLYNAGTPLSDVFRRSVAPLVDLFIAGFNVSLLVTGESGSGKSYFMAGENISRTGTVPMLMEVIFDRIREDAQVSQPIARRSDAQVTLEVVEVYNELVKDLLQVPALSPQYLSLDETATDGVHVKNCKVAPVRNAQEGEALFRQAWSRRSDHYTDFGLAKNYSSVIVHIDLIMQSADSLLPNKSRFTVMVTPGVEKLAGDTRQLRVREGPTLSKGIIALSQLVAALANQPYADRCINYRDSQLTSLLKDELGGNCKTLVLLCLRPYSDPDKLDPILRFVQQSTRVVNFPIPNDPFAQQLLTQYRAQILNLRQQLGWSTGATDPGKLHDLHDEMRRIRTENVTIRDQNDRLQARLDHLQSRFGNLATTKTDLSSQLLLTEEEKLKVSKTLVEMQIENNKLKEEMEAAKFELTNKIIHLESELTHLDVSRDKHSKAAAIAEERLATMERDRKQMADEYIGLKANYSALKEAHDKEVGKNEELSVELLNLVNAKAVLLRRLEKLESSPKQRLNPDAELERVRAMVSRMSTRRPEDLEASQQDLARTEQNVFGSYVQLEDEIKALKRQHAEEVHKLERRLTTMRKEVHDSRNIARERQRKASQINARLITLKGEADHLQNQNNKLQHRLKDSIDNFRSRLVKYIDDIAEYMDSRGDSLRKAGEPDMRQYVDGMLADMRKAHRQREEQLSQAAQQYCNQLKAVTHTHEQVLIAYSELREKLGNSQLNDLEQGPDVGELTLNEPEFASAHQKEIEKLREQLERAHRQLESLKLGLKVDHLGDETKTKRPDPGQPGQQTWAALRRQMREWSESTQQELEQERARLLTNNTLLEEENSELRSYIETHLKRYKDEISRLREMIGVTDAGGLVSPGPVTRRGVDRLR